MDLRLDDWAIAADGLDWLLHKINDIDLPVLVDGEVDFDGYSIGLRNYDD